MGMTSYINIWHIILMSIFAMLSMISRVYYYNSVFHFFNLSNSKNMEYINGIFKTNKIKPVKGAELVASDQCKLIRNFHRHAHVPVYSNFHQNKTVCSSMSLTSNSQLSFYKFILFNYLAKEKKKQMNMLL